MILRTEVPTGEYDVVLADFPWSYYGEQDKWGAAAKFYPTMTDDDILAFPLASLLAPTGVLFLWATCPRLDFAFSCLSNWGLHYRGVAFVWVKCTRSGRVMGARGVRPSVVKPTTELVLAASKVKKGRPMPLGSEAVRQVIMAPLQRHSEKPVEVHKRIEALYPKARRLELFARRNRRGWDCWGNEL